MDGREVVGTLALALTWAAALVLYARAARRGGRSWPVGRLLAFAGGSALVVAGLAPVWGDGFTGHVVSHLLIGMLGPFLVVAGDPLEVGLRRAHPHLRRRLLRLLHHPVLRALSRPVAAWLLVVVSLWVMWLTPVYGLTERHELLHAAAHAHFLASGLLFATVVLGVGPLGRQTSPEAGVFLVALLLPAHALLGLVLLSMDEPWLGVAGGGLDALADQRRGAVILWLAGDLIATVMLAATFPRWLGGERRRSRREDEWVDAQAAAST